MKMVIGKNVISFDIFNRFGISVLHKVFSGTLKSQFKCFQVFWVSVLFAAFSMTIFSTVQVIQNYLNAPVSTAIITVQSPKLELPDLVICPIRGLNVSKLIEDQMPFHIIDLIMLYFGTDFTWVPLAESSPFIDAANQQLEDWMKSKNFTDFKAVALYYSYEPSEFIHRIYNGIDNLVDEIEAATHADFGKQIGYDSAVCFTYINYHNYSIYWPGLVGGYQIILKLPEMKTADNSLTDGWSLGITRPLQAPPVSYVRIPTNEVVDVEISRVEIDRFPTYSWPRSGILCKDSPDYQNTDGCANFAYGKAVRKICNCTYIHSFELYTGKLRYCSPLEFYICTLKKGTEIKSLNRASSADCLPVCQETNFQAQMSHSSLNYPATIKKYNISSNNEVSIVRLSYTKMEYTMVMTYESITLSTVVSNIGGQLGLWIGASVISIVHLLSNVPFWVLKIADKVTNRQKSRKVFDSGCQTF